MAVRVGRGSAKEIPMTVRLNTARVSGLGVSYPGDVVDVPEGEGERLIASGQAELALEDPEEAGRGAEGAGGGSDRWGWVIGIPGWVSKAVAEAATDVASRGDSGGAVGQSPPQEAGVRTGGATPPQTDPAPPQQGGGIGGGDLEGGDAGAARAEPERQTDKKQHSASKAGRKR